MNPSMTLHGHLADLGGGLIVRRMLPAALRQAVGPFIFFDHFGPVTLQATDHTDVRPHPHIGLATVTYLFDGAMTHRDSLGTVQRIEPGAINWMTAGRGIVHSERTPEDLRHGERRVHGLQLWAALPQPQEACAPAFSHTAAADIPEVEMGAARVRVLIGSAWGVVSPVRTPSPTLYVDIVLPPGARIELPMLAEEMAVYAVDQPLELTDANRADRAAAHTMTVLTAPTRIANAAAVPARLVVIGGAPLDGRRFIWWNFVSSSKDSINRAADDWAAGRFATVPGETERIELPAKRLS